MSSTGLGSGPSSAMVAAQPRGLAASMAPGEMMRGRIKAYVELTKPRIGVMVLLTVGTGFLLGHRGGPHLGELFWTLLGAGLVASGSSAWNMVLERKNDALMWRTRGRPIPSGRVQPGEAAVFASVLVSAGVGILLVGTHGLSAIVAASTFFLYVLCYTPIKTQSIWNTVVGAIPGAMPPVIGWTAATGRFDAGAAALFLIMFLWQFPHFLAIAWVYRDDYARGHMRMLPVVDPTGLRTGTHAVAFALALVVAGTLPALLGLAGPIYLVGSLALGLYYLAASYRFLRDVSDTTARRLMRASFLYLPLVILLLILNPA